MLGLLLSVPSKTIHVTAKKNDEDKQKCCQEMLEGWLSSDHKASWGKLLEAVRSLPE